MRPIKPLLVTVATFALCICSPGAAADSLDVLRAQVEELKLDLDGPLDDFNAKYEQQLVALKDQAQQSGDLDLALAAAEELTGYKKGSRPSSDPKLKRLQDIYARESSRINKERSEKLATLLKGYKLRLEETTAELTKSGDLDNALIYRQETVAVGEQLEEIAASNAVAAPAPVETPAEEPEETEDAEFVAGTYKTAAGYGPAITFSDSGSYDAGFFGKGRWKTRGEKMIMNGSDEFTYNADNDTWVGTAFGGKTEVILKFAGAGEDRGGRGPRGEDSDGRPRIPRGREDFRNRD